MIYVQYDPLTGIIRGTLSVQSAWPHQLCVPEGTRVDGMQVDIARLQLVPRPPAITVDDEV